MRVRRSSRETRFIAEGNQRQFRARLVDLLRIKISFSSLFCRDSSCRRKPEQLLYFQKGRAEYDYREHLTSSRMGK